MGHPVPTRKMNQTVHPESGLAIIPASLEQKPILANLLELYIHDFCDFLELELHPDGRFGYNQLDLYWTDSARHPFLIKVHEKPAGFVFVRCIEDESQHEPLWDMAEFFILRGHRWRGIGTVVAHSVWDQFPGRWQVRVMAQNVPALRFWEHAVTTYTGDSVHSTQITGPGDQWHIFSFRSSPNNPTHLADETGK